MPPPVILFSVLAVLPSVRPADPQHGGSLPPALPAPLLPWATLPPHRNCSGVSEMAFSSLSLGSLSSSPRSRLFRTALPLFLAPPPLPLTPCYSPPCSALTLACQAACSPRSTLGKAFPTSPSGPDSSCVPASLVPSAYPTAYHTRLGSFLPCCGCLLHPPSSPACLPGNSGSSARQTCAEAPP